MVISCYEYQNSFECRIFSLYLYTFTSECQKYSPINFDSDLPMFRNL